MGFKTVKKYNDERYGDMFLLRNDGDYADVIFLYQKDEDVLVADTHYVKSPDYSGYVHCCGRGCPACGKGLRVQTKLFIPLFNLTTNRVEFWDRSLRFEPQLHQDVFTKYPNPSEIIFRVTRKGAAGDVNTVYQIMAYRRNNWKSFDQICAENGIVMPDYYSHVCREYAAPELAEMLNAEAAPSAYTAPADLPSYQITPRAQTNVPKVSTPVEGAVDLDLIDPLTPAAYEAPVMETSEGNADSGFGSSAEELDDSDLVF